MEINGCTRVSDILGWYQDLSKIPRDALERKADIGTRVHESIEAHLHDEFSVITEDIKGYMQSFMKWLNKANISVAVTERRFFDQELKLTGQIDCLFLQNGTLTLLDFKTSRKKNDKIWKLQGGFYYILARRENPDLNKLVKFLHLMPNGEIAKDYDYEIDAETINLCYSSLHLYRHFVTF